MGDATVSQGTPEALEARRKQVSSDFASAHDCLDAKGIPRFADEKVDGRLVPLTLKQRIVKLDSRWANNIGEPDSEETPSPPPNTETREADCERIARAFHDEYEAFAEANGWETQESTRVAFDDLPLANRATMTSTVRALVEQGLISTQPETKEPRYSLGEICERLMSGEAIQAFRLGMPDDFKGSIGDVRSAMRDALDVAAARRCEGCGVELGGVHRRTCPHSIAAGGSWTRVMPAHLTQPQHPDSEAKEGADCERCGGSRRVYWNFGNPSPKVPCPDCETTEAVSEEAVEAARQAGEHYLADLDEKRRAASEKEFGHSGAYIPRYYPDGKEKRRIELAAALPALEAAWRKRLEEELPTDRVIDAATGAAYTQPISQNRREDMRAAIEAALKEAAG